MVPKVVGGFRFVFGNGAGENRAAFIVADVEVGAGFDELLRGNSGMVPEGAHEGSGAILGVADVQVDSGVDEFLAELVHSVVAPAHGGEEGSAAVGGAGKVNVGAGGDEVTGGGDVALGDGEDECGVAAVVAGVGIGSGGEGFVDGGEIAAAGRVDDEPGGVFAEADVSVDAVLAEEVDIALVALVDGDLERGAVGRGLAGVGAGHDEDLRTVFVFLRDGVGEFAVAVFANGVRVGSADEQEEPHGIQAAAEPAHGGAEGAAAFVVEGVGVGSEGE